MTVCYYAESLLSDPFFNDDIEQLPGGCSISYYEINKFISYKNFTYCNNGKDVFIDDVVTAVKEFKEAYYLWDNFRLFGLPSGKGWLDEKPIVIDTIKFLSRCYTDIENFLYDKSKRNKF